MLLRLYRISRNGLWKLLIVRQRRKQPEVTSFSLERRDATTNMVTCLWFCRSQLNDESIERRSVSWLCRRWSLFSAQINGGRFLRNSSGICHTSEVEWFRIEYCQRVAIEIRRRNYDTSRNVTKMFIKVIIIEPFFYNLKISNRLIFDALSLILHYKSDSFFLLLQLNNIWINRNWLTISTVSKYLLVVQATTNH